MLEEHRLEMKVGVLLAAALLGCAGLLYLLGEFNAGGSRVFVDLSHSGGIPDGAPVKFAGVRVGRVRRLELHPARRDERGKPLPVRLEVEIEEEVFEELGSDVQLLIATQGPLGEPFLELEAGAADAPPLIAGAVLRANDPPRMDQMMPKLVAFLDSAQAIVGDGQRSEGLLRDAAAVASQTRGLLEQHGAAAGQAIQDLSASAAQLRALVAVASVSLGRGGQASQALEDMSVLAAQLRRDLPAITEKAQQAIDGAASVAASFTPEDVARLREALAGYEKAGASLNQVAARAERLLSEVEQGKGSLGMFAKDPQLYEDLKALVTDLKRHPWKVFWKD